MPGRYDLTELTTGQIRGCPFAVAHARGGQLVLYVAGEDDAGLVEGPAECLAAARRYRQKRDALDKPPAGGEDSGGN